MGRLPKFEMYLQKKLAGEKFSASFSGKLFVFVMYPDLFKNGTDTPPTLGAKDI